MPTELEKLERAKRYMEQLAEGFDPLSGQELPGDSALNLVRLSRCFFYVADILQQVIGNGGQVGRVVQVSSKHLPPFALTREQRGHIEIVDELLFIRKFTEKINALIDPAAMKKLKEAAFGAWLLEKGFLTEEIHSGNRARVPTAAGREIGISSEFRQTSHGAYTALFYNRDAQQFLADNLDEIIAVSNGDRSEES